MLVRRLLSNTLHLILKSTNPSRPLYIDFVLLAWKSHLHYSKGVDGWSDEKPARINPFTSQNFECRPAWLKSCQTSTNQRNHHCSSIYTIYYLLSIIYYQYLLSIIYHRFINCIYIYIRFFYIMILYYSSCFLYYTPCFRHHIYIDRVCFYHYTSPILHCLNGFKLIQNIRFRSLLGFNHV